MGFQALLSSANLFTYGDATLQPSQSRPAPTPPPRLRAQTRGWAGDDAFALRLPFGFAVSGLKQEERPTFPNAAKLAPVWFNVIVKVPPRRAVSRTGPEYEAPEHPSRGGALTQHAVKRTPKKCLARHGPRGKRRVWGLVKTVHVGCGLFN